MTRLEALLYIRNTGGGATVDNFVEDWEPVGGLEWDMLGKAFLVEVRNGKIFLTPKGLEELDRLQGHAKAEARAHLEGVKHFLEVAHESAANLDWPDEKAKQDALARISKLIREV